MTDYLVKQLINLNFNNFTRMCVKIIELIGSSSKSFEQAMQEGVSRACKTLKNVTGVDVVGQTAVVKKGKIVEYKVNMKVAFGLED